MARKTDITGMADAITSALKDHGAEVGEAVEEAVDKVSKTTLLTIRKTAPKLTGSYRKGWRGRVRVSSKGRYVREIYNKTDYQLTHLPSPIWSLRNARPKSSCGSSSRRPYNDT